MIPRPWHTPDCLCPRWQPTEDRYQMLKALDPRLENFVADKLGSGICPVGQRYGGLTAEWAGRLGLPEGMAVGACLIDSHAGLPACGITRPGQMM